MQRIGVNFHICGFHPTVGLQYRFPAAAQNVGDTQEVPLCTASSRWAVFHRIASYDAGYLAVKLLHGEQGSRLLL